MKPNQSLALVGSGPSAIYLLKHVLDNAEILQRYVDSISIFEKSGILGVGMPYSPETTDRYNMSNISSEELPELTESFASWLRAQDPGQLRELGVEDSEISDSEVYARLALGEYLKAQYREIVRRLADYGIGIHEHAACGIADVKDLPDEECVILVTARGEKHRFNQVVLATGHRWSDEDVPEAGYYASPWPISKLIPPEGSHHNFAVGTLGASLSAFDVISSLAHRHGTFVQDAEGRMTYHPDPGTENFRIVMHASQGLLPHLQFDQEEPMRKIYRHVRREELLALRDEAGFLRIDTFFDKVCRPTLVEAFTLDKMPEMVEKLGDSRFGLRDFVAQMTEEHDYDNAFEGMREEMGEAKKSVLGHRPIHWKEIIDDLMYTLNFHAELMPAEDHLTLHEVVLPFQMNVIAAMPLPSGNTILALYDAGKISLVSGKATVAEKSAELGVTTVTVKEEEKETSADYRMFIDCSGQSPLELDDYPFPSLVEAHVVSRGRVPFADASLIDSVPDERKEHLFKSRGEWVYHLGGVGIDGTYRVIGRDGRSNPRIH